MTGESRKWLELLEEHEELDRIAGEAFYIAFMLAERGA